MHVKKKLWILLPKKVQEIGMLVMHRADYLSEYALCMIHRNTWNTHKKSTSGNACSWYANVNRALKFRYSTMCLNDKQCFKIHILYVQLCFIHHTKNILGNGSITFNQIHYPKHCMSSEFHIKCSSTMLSTTTYRKAHSPDGMDLKLQRSDEHFHHYLQTSYRKKKSR